MKRLAIIISLFLLTPLAHAQVIDQEPIEPEIVDELIPIPPSFPINFDDVDDLIGEDPDILPPQWATGDTFAMVSVDRANLRTQPSLDEGIVADIAIWGERFMIVGIYYPGESTVREPETDDFVFDDPGEREVWYLVASGGGAAWIFGGLVIVANPETLDAFENQTLTPEQQAYIDAQVAFAAGTVATQFASRLRSGPGQSFAQVGIVPFRGRVTVIGRNEFSTWFYVNYNGKQGWLHFELLAIPNGFNAAAIPIIR